ncbi:ribonuclease HIII [uncultured Leuconostoc sp.]|uniref:AFWIR motif membrane protein n=1 Tax=uncultured Leuconostoc sp. TaxID=173262 RepID=UPI0025E939F9|nr:ribonuclease HIII [uncultured Leuconostoc sp.]
MSILFLIPVLILFLIIYFFALLFTNTLGIIPRLVLAIVLILLVSFIIKNFFAIIGVIVLISLAFWIRMKFIKKRTNKSRPGENTFDGQFEEINKDK